jgi:transposase
VAEEPCAIGAELHVAEPAETAARRGRKKRPKTDRADARHLRELLLADRVPESWIPQHILDLRARARLRHTLVDQASGSSGFTRCSTITAVRSSTASVC